MSEEIAPFEIFRRHYMTAPDYQLSLCPISKSMSTVAMNIFCYLYDPISFVKNNQSISTSIWAKRLCKNINEFKSYDDLASKIGNKVYHTIAVIRDPLSRFISGYLDKCVRPVRKCFGCEIEDLRCVLTRLKMMLATKPKIITFEVNPYALELLHMAPQTWYCEMRKVFENMIFVKYGQSGLEHERMVRDLTVALNFTKVPPDQIDYIEKELKQNSRTSHSTEKMDLRKVFFEELTTRSDLQTLFWSIYENDYKIFDFQFLK